MSQANITYYRNKLKTLKESSSVNAWIFIGRYKHHDNEKWLLLTTIRLYKQGIKNASICNHINLRKSDVERYIHLSESKHNHKVYFVGEVYQYIHSNEIRWGLKLANLNGISSIWFANIGQEKVLENIKNAQNEILIQSQYIQKPPILSN